MTKQFLFSASLLEKHLNQCIDRHTDIHRAAAGGGRKLESAQTFP